MSYEVGPAVMWLILAPVLGGGGYAALTAGEILGAVLAFSLLGLFTVAAAITTALMMHER